MIDLVVTVKALLLDDTIWLPTDRITPSRMTGTLKQIWTDSLSMNKLAIYLVLDKKMNIGSIIYCIKYVDNV